MKTRSKNEFKKVFIQMLENNAESTISVTDIIRNSDYSRSSFYRDYYDYNDFVSHIIQDEASWLAKELFALMRGYSADHSLSQSILEEILSEVYSRKSLYHYIFTSGVFSSDIAGSGFSVAVMQEFKKLGTFDFNNTATVDEDFFRFSETIRFLRYLLFWDLKNYECSVEYMVNQIQSMNNLNYDKGNISSFLISK